jgi:peptidoglycan/LPS O-acetylase OafA/YrhL
MIIFSIVGLLAMYILRTIFADRAFGKFPLAGILFIYWYPFFHFGVFVNMFREEVNEWICRGKRLILYLVPACFLLALFEGFFWCHQGFISIGTSQIKASSFTLSFLLFLVSLSYQHKNSFFDTKLIAWLGRGSFVIYLSHMFALGRVKALLSQFEFIFQTQPLFIFLATSVTLSLCALLILLIEKSPLQKIKQYIGI